MSGSRIDSKDFFQVLGSASLPECDPHLEDAWGGCMASTLFLLNTIVFMVAAHNATGDWAKLFVLVSVACFAAAVYCRERKG